jgi:hypothetical protein
MIIPKRLANVLIGLSSHEVVLRMPLRVIDGLRYLPMSKYIGRAI